MRSRSVALKLLAVTTVVTFFIAACTGGEGGDAEPAGADPLDATLNGEPDEETVEYENVLEVQLATPQLNNLAGLHWGSQTATSMYGNTDIVAAIDVLAATPQLFGSPNCGTVGEDLEEGADEIQATLDDNDVDTCAETADPNACTAGAILWLMSKISPSDFSNAAGIFLLCAEASPTPSPTPSGSATASETASETPTPMVTDTTMASPTATTTDTMMALTWSD